MRYFKIIAFASILILIVLSLFTGNAFGQVSISPAGPLTYHVFLVADLGLEGGGKGNKDFQITFGAGPTGQQEITIDVTDFNTGDLLVTGATDPHDYATEIQGTYFIGQLDDLFGGDFDVVDDATDLYDKVLATGRLPRGRFRITVGLNPNGASTSIIVNIAPPYMQPLYPVEVQTNRAVLDFRWITNINRQELHIYTDPFGNREVLAGSRLPYTRIPSTASIWNPQAQRVDGSIVSPVLKDGAILYWQIQGYIKTSHGDERTESVLTAFQYFENAQSLKYIGLSDPDKQAIKDLLIKMLQEIVDNRAARSIEQYDITRIAIDNSPATREEIMTILQAIISGDVTATSVQFQ